MKDPDLTILAGPCSIDDHNISEIYDIANLTIPAANGMERKAITGTRVVGLKSRTELNVSGSGMGIDYPLFHKNSEMLLSGGCVRDLEVLPSVRMAEQIVRDTDLLIAAEIMNPLVQVPMYEGRVPEGKLMCWNPAVNQLGWPLETVGQIVKRNNWQVGIKNGKWLGESVNKANTSTYTGQTTLEKTWAGLCTYVQDVSDVLLIHRGVDVGEKGNYRNYPVHEVAKRTKQKTKRPLYFDPSHAYGPKMQSHIVPAVIEAMRMKISDEEFLYDGILIEVGTSSTDTDQHISLSELKDLVGEVATFRVLRGR